MKVLKWLGFSFFSLLVNSLAAHAGPVIDSIGGVLTDGQTITIAGRGFTEKLNAKPLLYWRADDGLSPSTLGRKTVWDGGFNGKLVSRSDPGVIVAEGSNKAVQMDFYESSGGALAKVSFESDRLYVWRKRYDNFDADYAYAIRTRLKNLVPLVDGASLGDSVIMATKDKLIKGKSISINVSDTDATVFYERDFGNINNISYVTGKVEKGDTVYLYASSDEELTNPLYEATLNEGKGVFYTFNHKTIRFWGKYSSGKNNTYTKLGDGVDSPLGSSSILVSEYTQVSTLWGRDWLKRIDHATRRWVREEYQYQAGDVDVENGQLQFWQDGDQAWDVSRRFRFRTSSYPLRYSDLYQAQVSNGAQIGTLAYYDSLYVDDTWHRIIVCESNVFSSCKQREIQLPMSWSDNEVTFRLNVNSLSQSDGLYVYLIDSYGKASAAGTLLCGKCPVGTALSFSQ